MGNQSLGCNSRDGLAACYSIVWSSSWAPGVGLSQVWMEGYALRGAGWWMELWRCWAVVLGNFWLDGWQGQATRALTATCQMLTAGRICMAGCCPRCFTFKT